MKPTAIEVELLHPPRESWQGREGFAQQFAQATTRGDEAAALIAWRAMHNAYGEQYTVWWVTHDSQPLGMIRIISSHRSNPQPEHYAFVEPLDATSHQQAGTLLDMLHLCVMNTQRKWVKLYPNELVQAVIAGGSFTEINRYVRFELPVLDAWQGQPNYRSTPDFLFDTNDRVSNALACELAPVLTQAYRDQPYHEDFDNQKMVVPEDLLAEAQAQQQQGGFVRYAIARTASGAVAGLAVARVPAEPELGPINLGSIAVVPQFRGRGLAKRLVRFCLQTLHSTGFEGFGVYSEVSVHNEPMQGVFRSFGFQENGGGPEYVFRID